MSSRLKITLKRGMVGVSPAQRGTIRALGLKRIGQTVEKEDCPELRGMVFKVRHLVDTEEVSETSKSKQAKSEGK